MKKGGLSAQPPGVHQTGGRRLILLSVGDSSLVEAQRWRGHGYGIACGIDSRTYVAHMSEVQLDRKPGRVQVKRVVCAQDMGLSINPEGAKIQMEGCITMALG